MNGELLLRPNTIRNPSGMYYQLFCFGRKRCEKFQRENKKFHCGGNCPFDHHHTFKSAYVYATNSSGFVINPYHTPDASQPRTTTAYDAANRPVESVGLDGAVTNTLYGNRSVYVQDANQHMRASFFDAVGQLVKVDETIDTFSDDFNDNNLDGWSVGAGTSVSNGVVSIAGDGT